MPKESADCLVKIMSNSVEKISERHFSQINLSTELFDYMVHFCEKHHMYRNRFIQHAIIGRLIFDEDFQKEIISIALSDPKLSNSYHEIEGTLNFINKIKPEYERRLELIINLVLKKKRATNQNEQKEKIWTLKSPEGKIYECSSIFKFIGENPDLFGIEKNDKDAIVQLSRALGRSYIRRTAINGWEISFKYKE